MWDHSRTGLAFTKLYFTENWIVLSYAFSFLLLANYLMTVYMYAAQLQIYRWATQSMEVNSSSADKLKVKACFQQFLTFACLTVEQSIYQKLLKIKLIVSDVGLGLCFVIEVPYPCHTARPMPYCPPIAILPAHCRHVAVYLVVLVALKNTSRHACLPIEVLGLLTQQCVYS